ncbi:hypothetical protein ACSBR1_032032 [Camellia fascicularis]
MSEMFSLEQFNFGRVSDNYSSSMGFEREEGMNAEEHTHLYGEEEWGGKMAIDSFSSDLGFFVENAAEDGLLLSRYQQERQQQLLPYFGILDDLYLDIVSPPFQSCHEETEKHAIVDTENSLLDEPKKEKPCAIPFASLGILKNYWSGSKRLNREKVEVPSHGIACTMPEPKLSGQKLSTMDILRLAGEKFIHSSSQTVDDRSTLSHPFGNSFLGLSDDEIKDMELVQNLLASAEKVGQQQYERAGKLLSQCDDDLSSDTGNPVQRAVYYFSEALRERIDQETGRISLKGSKKKLMLDLNEALICPNLAAIIAFHQEMPFYQVCQFSGMQAIIEHVAESKKVHLIDLEIRNGIQCIGLIQALAGRSESPLERLKITAVGTNSKSTIEDTGERLMSFAQSMNLPFSFNVVLVSDMLDLNEDLFDLEAEETVAVNSTCSLRAMLTRPDRLESLMRVLKNINPCLMVVTEVEANHNSPIFVNRFIEALFFYGAFFDCLEDCMDRYNPNRNISESMYLSQAIQNIVATEGEERIIRHVNINVWRAFFARFGMVEEEMSTSSLYQASLVTKKFACGSSCMIDMDGKCLIIGWKGTPLHSLSAWKFV